MQQILSDIAKRELNIPTLEMRGSDRLDFHEVYAPNLGKALTAAFQSGQESVLAQPLLALSSCLSELLDNIATTSGDATAAFSDSRRNEAIGILLPNQEQLQAASSILQAIFTLHRHGLKGGAQ